MRFVYVVFMIKKQTNYAFIDSQNVTMALKELGWSIGWERFRVYLSEKYGVSVAYLFLGYVPEQQNMYRFLQKAGFVLIFKEILKYKDGTIKGNVDAELVLQAMIDWDDYEKAVLITGDGDFACLVRHLREKQKLEMLLVPNIKKYSSLLKKAAAKQIESLDVLRNKIEYTKKRTPSKKRTP